MGIKIANEELGRLSVTEFKAAEKRRIILVLDNIRSMHNVGSAFRTADSFLLEKILLCGFTACPPHREIQKAALGATESVEWEHFGDTCEAVRKLQAQGYKVFAVEQVKGAVSLERFRDTFADAGGVLVAVGENDGGLKQNGKSKVVETLQPIALVFGNEVDGVQQEVVDICDGAVEIPQWGTKHSLNVSVSIGIVLWELVR